MNIRGAYAGVRVLDLGQDVAAPYCAMPPAMHGAEVIKLEPLAGDWLADPHVVATGGADPVDQPGTGKFPTSRAPGVPLTADAALPSAPRIGEHGAAILAELGLDPKTIARLCAENIMWIPEGA